MLVALGLVSLVTSTGWRFAIVGDSVTTDAREELAARDGLVEANGGVDIRTGRQAIRQLAHHGRERIVIELGIMDVSFWATEDELRQRIRAVMRDDLADVNCPIWVDLKTTSPVHPHWPMRSAQFNQVLTELGDQYGVHVARWSAVAPHHPDWFRDDGIHLRQVGQRGYARFIAHQVEHFCG